MMKMATQQAVSESNVLHNKFEVGEGSRGGEAPQALLQQSYINVYGA
jgi:hypothetical protein